LCEKNKLATPDDIFDDATGDVAIGDLGGASRSTAVRAADPDFSTAGTRLGWR